MTDIYDRIFFVLCRWDGFVNRGMFQEARPFDAVVMMSGLNFLNLLAVIFWMGKVVDYDLLGLGSATKLGGVVVMAVVLGFNYLYFIKSERCEGILAKYKNTPIHEIKGSVAITVAYALFSFFAFLISLFVFM